MPEPWIRCPTCDALRWRPAAKGNVILYCKSCDACLDAPSFIPLLDRSSQMDDGAKHAPAPEGDSDDHAGAVSLPTILPLDELGPLVEAYRTEKLPFTAIVVVTFFALASTGFGAFLAYLNDRRAVFVLIIATIWILGIPIAIYYFLRTRLASQTVLLFENGLVRFRFGRSRVFLWDDIAAVYFGREITVQHRDGSRISFGDLSSKKRRKVEQYAQQELALRLLPEIMDIYQSGDVVEFGALGICQTGLVKGGKRLRWNEISRLYIDIHQTLCVVRTGSILRWHAQPIGKIPNYFILEQRSPNTLNWRFRRFGIRLRLYSAYLYRAS